jgi:hypothetical protein
MTHSGARQLAALSQSLACIAENAPMSSRLDIARERIDPTVSTTYYAALRRLLVAP